MAIGERLRFFRKLQGMKLKELGRKMGFPEKSADVRMAQYLSLIHICTAAPWSGPYLSLWRS